MWIRSQNLSSDPKKNTLQSKTAKETPWHSAWTSTHWKRMAYTGCFSSTCLICVQSKYKIYKERHSWPPVYEPTEGCGGHQADHVFRYHHRQLCGNRQGGELLGVKRVCGVGANSDVVVVTVWGRGQGSNSGYQKNHMEHRSFILLPFRKGLALSLQCCGLTERGILTLLSYLTIERRFHIQSQFCECCRKGHIHKWPFTIERTHKKCLCWNSPQ